MTTPEPEPMMVPLILTLDRAPLTRAEERWFVEQASAATLRLDGDGNPAGATFWTMHDDRPGVYDVALIVSDPALFGDQNALRELVEQMSVMIRAVTEPPFTLRAAATQEELARAGTDYDRLYTPNGWTDRKAEAQQLADILNPPPPPKSLTEQEIFAALGALGKAPLIPNELQPTDRARLLGVLLAVVEQELFLTGETAPDVTEVVSDVNQGYLAQLAADRDGGATAFAASAARLKLVQIVLTEHVGKSPMYDSAAAAASAASRMLSLAALGKSGEDDEQMLRSLLKATKTDIQISRQKYEEMLRVFRSHGVKI